MYRETIWRLTWSICRNGEDPEEDWKILGTQAELLTQAIAPGRICETIMSVESSVDVNVVEKHWQTTKPTVRERSKFILNSGLFTQEFVLMNHLL